MIFMVVFDAASSRLRSRWVVTSVRAKLALVMISRLLEVGLLCGSHILVLVLLLRFILCALARCSLSCLFVIAILLMKYTLRRVLKKL
jgi:hypothetical protein